MDVNLAVHLIFQKYFNKVFHRNIAPGLDSFSDYFATSDPDEVLLKITGANVVMSSPYLREEFNLLTQALNERYKNIILEYPSNFATELSTSYFLYSIVRIVKPMNIVETGVANGHSSYFMLNALLKNQSGTLHSFDVDKKVGKLISEDEKKRWDLNILPVRRRKSVFQDTMKKFVKIDMFVHDSNHFYYWQMFEYRTAWEVLKDGGLLLSDDVDSSYAYLDYCKEISIKPIFLSDGRKMFGAALKSP
ncbi:MAG: class I SAM-dependent methyltransferase [Thermoplasmataceae archaeon]|jgi:predicted O-methyltransferase YrrM